MSCTIFQYKHLVILPANFMAFEKVAFKLLLLLENNWWFPILVSLVTGPKVNGIFGFGISFGPELKIGFRS